MILISKFLWPILRTKKGLLPYHLPSSSSSFSMPCLSSSFAVAFPSFLLCRACHHWFTSSFLPFSAPSSSSLNLTSIGFSLGGGLQQPPSSFRFRWTTIHILQPLLIVIIITLIAAAQSLLIDHLKLHLSFPIVTSIPWPSPIIFSITHITTTTCNTNFIGK